MEPADVAQVDQANAASRSVGGMRAAFYRGAVEGGMPRWLAAVTTIVYVYGADVAAEYAKMVVTDDDGSA